MKFKAPLSIVLMTTALLLAFQALQAGPSEQDTFRYISPVPGSRYVMPGNNIALRHGDPVNAASLSGLVIEVTGSASGAVPGRVTLSSDGRTILFLPDRPCQPGEEVHVVTHGAVTTLDGTRLSNVDFTFHVAEEIPLLPQDFSLAASLEDLTPKMPVKYRYEGFKGKAKDNDLPDDFPELTAEVLNATYDNGYYFVSPFGHWGWFPDNTPYLIAFDDHATPVFYRRLEQHGYDFKWNANGQLSFLFNEWPQPYYQVLDDRYQVVDILTMQNGYYTDFHEFFILENGHAFIMAYDPQLVDMSQVVPGGVEDAIVIGWVFQELDTDKNVVFQWRSWDHYDILDAQGYVNLTASTIDLIHGNAIEVTPDGNALLLSPRNLNEITKVDRNTGEIIWRLNGNNNMFEFIGDTLGFSWQHDCRVLANGNISIFDNGTYHPEPQFSSMVEYAIDEENMTATLVRRLRNDPDILGLIMGSAREMPGGNIVAGWGSGVPGVTEFDTDGNVAATYYFAGINYRAYRHHWETGAITTDAGALDYGWIWMEDQKTKQVKVTNPTEEEIVITGHHLRTGHFIVENDFPVSIPAGASAAFDVTFVPSAVGDYSDVLTLNSDINTDELVQRIARQVKLTGHATQGQGIGDDPVNGILLSPNPAGKHLSLSFQRPRVEVRVTLTDVTGQELMTGHYRDVISIRMDIGHLPAGLYFVSLDNSRGERLGVLKFIKK